MPRSHLSTRRVVITGMGVIAANGQDLPTFWKSVCDGDSGASLLDRFDVSAIPCKVAAQVRGFDASRFMEPKIARRLDRSTLFGVAAAKLAVDDAKLNLMEVDADRVGVVEASSLSNNEAAYEAKAAYLKRGYRGVPISAMINGAAGGGSGEIAHLLGCKGHAITMSSTSASGNDAMGYALSMIKYEDVDVMIAGGAEAPLIESVWGGFCLNRVMTRHIGDPKTAMRPFDRFRDGFVLGEGAAFIVMEELTHAMSRHAKVYAEVLSHGRSCEAYHPIAPHPEGIGYVRAIEKATQKAHISCDQIDYINAHGTATELNDLVETKAIKKAFGIHSGSVSISSTKPITGHTMAAAGAVETVITALAIHHSLMPMTLNIFNRDEQCDLDNLANESRHYPIKIAINLNSGFGGKNSCLILARFNP